MLLSERQPIEILLVEDNPGDVRLIQEALREGAVPANLHIARDGVEAEAYLSQGEGYLDALRPDIILLDLNLPRKDGRELLQWVKSQPSIRDIPVLVLTSSEAEDDVTFCYRHHTNAYLTKPLKIEDYFGLIKSLEEFWFNFVRLPKV